MVRSAVEERNLELKAKWMGVKVDGGRGRGQQQRMPAASPAPLHLRLAAVGLNRAPLLHDACDEHVVADLCNSA